MIKIRKILAQASKHFSLFYFCFLKKKRAMAFTQWIESYWNLNSEKKKKNFTADLKVIATNERIMSSSHYITLPYHLTIAYYRYKLTVWCQLATWWVGSSWSLETGNACKEMVKDEDTYGRRTCQRNQTQFEKMALRLTLRTGNGLQSRLISIAVSVDYRWIHPAKRHIGT